MSWYNRTIIVTKKTKAPHNITFFSIARKNKKKRFTKQKLLSSSLFVVIFFFCRLQVPNNSITHEEKKRRKRGYMLFLFYSFLGATHNDLQEPLIEMCNIIINIIITIAINR